MEKEIKEINCKVSNCIYNRDDHKCIAGHIDVGTNDAKTKSETRCSTFESRSQDHCSSDDCSL